jgi:ATP-dependent Clp protease protease subunit
MAQEIKREGVRLLEEDMPSLWIRQFTFEAAQEFVKRFTELESDSTLEDIFVYVSSYGGEIFPLLMMYEAIASSTKNVHLIGMGGVYSAGADLVTLGPQGNRWLGANSYMHIHHAVGGSEGSLLEMEQYVQELKQLNTHITKLIVANCGLTAKDFKKHLDDHNGEWRMTPKEALKYGFIDRIGIPTVRKYEVWEYEG